MKSLRKIFAIFSAISMAAILAYAQTTEFTYQGSLKDGASPANGTYDFELALYDGSGGQLGGTLTRNGVVVANGIFGVSLDFGNQFSGATRLLEIRVRPSGGSGFTTLSPRQPVNSSPYSVKSLSADSATTAANFTGPLAGDVTGPQNATVLANNVVTNTKLADSAVTAAKIASGQAVKGVTVGTATLTDNVTLAGSGNITVTPIGNTVTIGSTGGGLTGGMTNAIPVWTSPTTLGTSQISQSAAGVQLPANVQLAAAGNGGQVQFGSPNGETGMSIQGSNR